jgi:hypothetical protein
MKAIQFLFQITIIILLWKSIWGLIDIAVDNYCVDDNKKRAIVYITLILLLITLYWTNPDHFIHA